MTQSKAEAEFLMEQQHGFNTSQGNFHENIEDDDKEQDDENYCFYCGEPLDDGMCTATCKESASDEGRLDYDEEGQFGVGA